MKDLDLEVTRHTHRDKDRVHVTMFCDKREALEIIRKLVVGMQDNESKEFQFSVFGKEIK